MRLPFAPLTEAVGEVWHYNPVNNQYIGKQEFGRGHSDLDVWQRCNGNPVTVISELTGINRRTLTRWVNDGIRDDDADRIACALGYHVAEIWPQWFDEDTA